MKKTLTKTPDRDWDRMSDIIDLQAEQESLVRSFEANLDPDDDHNFWDTN